MGSILQSYDQFKQFPLFGFGGIPHFLGERQVNHCFPLNGCFEAPEVNGIQGVVDAYRRNLQEIQFAGPTFFSSITEIFMDFANEGEVLKTYFVLLIITDGNIHDMKETKELIVQASKLPCSIIIVGVGNSDFDQMIDLDSDENLLKDHRNNFASRDIVQFVKFREAIARNNLAEELLKEIPSQVCRYMENIGYKPVPIQTDMHKIEVSVKKQLDMIMKKKGVVIDKIQTEAKDVVDKAALYSTDEVQVNTTVTSGFPEKASATDDETKVAAEFVESDEPAKKRRRRRGNKIGAVAKPTSTGDDDANDGALTPKKIKKVSPFKLPKI